jgi:type I restriction enzyme R subunit
LTAKPESRAREQSNRQLTDAGWIVQDRAAANLGAGLGVAVREFPLKGGPVDCLLYVDGAAAGAVEAKKEGWDPQLNPYQSCLMRLAQTEPRLA